MRIKIVTLLLLSAIISGCAVYPEQGKNNQKVVKTNTKKVTKKSASKSNQAQIKKVSYTINEGKSYQVNNDKTIDLSPMINTKSLNNKFFEYDKNTLLKCEKQGICLKEIIIINNRMIFKVDIPNNVYNDLKNKDNAVTYFNNDVKIFKSNPKKYLQKYGLIHKKYENAENMLLNLPEVQIKDIFSAEVFARFNPF
jgi:hypothetical protein